MKECITNGGFCVKQEGNYCPAHICELEQENCEKSKAEREIAFKYFMKGAEIADKTSKTEHIKKDFETHFELVYPIK